MPTPEQARQWLDRWDRQQERYIADRDERFAVIADVVAAATGRSDPTIVDLGAGPGSLSVRLLDRFPQAHVVAVDADPLLLGLARAAFADLDGLRIVERDLRVPGWPAQLGVEQVDAIVSTTALHWLTGTELSAVYRDCAALLRPGGVLVDGDHFDEGGGQAVLDTLARRVQDARAARVGVLANEDWSTWWQAVEEAPELAALVQARGPRSLGHSEHAVPSLRQHTRLLRAAGFTEVGTVWQHGLDHVLVAVR
jgi:SAM-dependent methyltransferase